MADTKKKRQTAVPIGRIVSIETDVEIGLIYQWDNGEMQVAMYSARDIEQNTSPCLAAIDLNTS